MGLLGLRASRLTSWSPLGDSPPRTPGLSPQEVLQAVRGWSQDRREEWEERAAIREIDGGLLREDAEVLAYLDLQKEGL